MTDKNDVISTNVHYLNIPWHDFSGRLVARAISSCDSFRPPCSYLAALILFLTTAWLTYPSRLGVLQFTQSWHLVRLYISS
jgi:hypothetical protein